MGRLPARTAAERRRERGQVWTPDWVADAMVEYCLAEGARSLFDPAVGAGAFLLAASRFSQRTGSHVSASGCEIDPRALEEARRAGVSRQHLRGIALHDFTLTHQGGPYPAIVANPPYLRHHRLPASTKAGLRELATTVTGARIDGRAGLHVYFLIRALERLAPGGRLAFLIPADTVEGVFAPALWDWIAKSYCLDAVVTFDASATPFPGVDTNALIVMIRRAPPSSRIVWARCEIAGEALRAFVAGGFLRVPGVAAYRRSLGEALAAGLSRAPSGQRGGPVLGQFARVQRGIATGANEFFFLTRDAARRAGLPRSALRPAVGRTRDIDGDTITPARLAKLDRAGRPTLLLSLDGDHTVAQSPALREYLRRGELVGLPDRALIGKRNPWFRMETRATPPFLFAYLGRRRARFVRNDAGVVPLTSFLCVYPKRQSKAELAWLWRVLSDPATVANLRLVGKSYGGGAIKVEPRALERLPIPAHLVRGRPPSA